MHTNISLLRPKKCRYAKVYDKIKKYIYTKNYDKIKK